MQVLIQQLIHLLSAPNHETQSYPPPSLQFVYRYRDIWSRKSHTKRLTAQKLTGQPYSAVSISEFKIRLLTYPHAF